MQTTVRRTLILTVSLTLLLCSASLRLGNVAPDDIRNHSLPGSIDSWHFIAKTEFINHSTAELKANNIDKARHYSFEALRTNPTSGQAARQLLEVYKKAGDIENGDKVAILTSELWPADSLTRAGLADYWLSRGELERLLPEWNNVLIRQPVTYETVFPALQKLLASEQTASLLLPYIQNSPNWWPAFFAYLTKNEEPLDTLKAIYNIRAQSEHPITAGERNSFVNRLIKENLPQEAYYAWLSGLDTESLKLTGLVYDGGFEGQSFDGAFDWQISRPKGVKIRTNTTSGVTGLRALQIIFNTKRLNFKHLNQRLNLAQGNYQLSGRYRLNRLRTSEGLRWRIYCTDSKETVRIAESEAFKGRSPWQSFSLNFSIPDKQCFSQLLRLEVSSRYAHHHAFKGSLWFDDIAIQRKTEETESPANAQ